MKPALALCLLALCLPALARAGDDYGSMLGYLAGSRIDGQAYRDASGAIATNLAAGDLNQQANLRSLATGDQARGSVQAQQLSRGDRSDAPSVAVASIGGQAYDGARGIASINQVSGSRNAQLNAVAAALAAQGIRETTDGTLSAAVSASAGGQAAPDSRTPSGSVRSVAVQAGAMRGFEGVLQLNQTAGSGNATGNALLLSVAATPR